MEDVPDPPEQRTRLSVRESGFVGESTSNVPLSPEEIEAAITGKTVVPKQEEVNASIEELRPQSNILESKDFARLGKRLVAGYNVRQLAQYLVSSGRTATTAAQPLVQQVDANDAGIFVSPWRSGRSPLEERIGRILVDKNDIGSSKARLADQIMRVRWNLTTYSEERQLGELELSVKPWQIKMLFDLKVDDKPAIESFINAKLVLQTSDIRPYRPDNIVRVTAKRRDAEDIAQTLQRKLGNVRQLDMNLHVFNSLLGRNGWPKQMCDVFQKEDVDFVSERTGCVIERPNWPNSAKVSIYSMPERAEHAAHARRLLLSLLDLPSATSTTVMVMDQTFRLGSKANIRKSDPEDVEQLALAEYPAFSLPRRYRVAQLFRTTTPLHQNQAEVNAAVRPSGRPEPSPHGTSGAFEMPKPSQFEYAIGILQDTPSAVERVASQRRVHSVWNYSPDGERAQWTAKFCTLLRPADDSRPQSKKSQPATMLPVDSTFITMSQVPRLSQLLSYFQPAPPSDLSLPSDMQKTDVDHHRPYLRASFLPSPFLKNGIDAVKALPRIAASYHFIAGDTSNEPKLFDVQADLETQELQVHFPGEAVDLSFTRTTAMHMKQTSEQPKSLQQIELFTRRLQTSMGAGSGTLDAMPELEIPLPSWIAKRLQKPSAKVMKGKKDKPTPYLLERLEQIHTIDLVPGPQPSKASTIRDPGIKHLTENWPSGMVLRLREIEAGVTGGRSTELSLFRRREIAADGEGVEGDGHESPVPEADSNADGVVESETRKLGAVAEQVIRLITRANAGQLAPMVRAV